MRVIDVPWNESRGVCWARAEIMKLWEGEDFFLQLDSHHRFVQNWDALLIAQAERTGAAKPLLSTYATPYDPRALRLRAFSVCAWRFRHGGAVRSGTVFPRRRDHARDPCLHAWLVAVPSIGACSVARIHAELPRQTLGRPCARTRHSD